MEYLPGGELFEYIWERQGLTEEQAKPIFKQIVAALAHCHQVCRFIDKIFIKC